MSKNNLPLLFFPIISLILGINWQKLYCCNIYLIFLTILTILFTILISNQKTINLRSLQILTLPIFFFSGAFLFQCQKNKHQFLSEKLKKIKIDIIAKVKDKQETDEKIKEILKIKVKQIKYNKQQIYQKTNFDIICYIKTSTNTNIGDTIELKNISPTIPITKLNISGNPMFKDYLTKENIIASIFTKKLIYKKIYSEKYSLKKWLWNKKNTLFKNLKTKLLPISTSYFCSIFLGNKKEKSFSDLKTMFSHWGICHYLARSGLHIILFILIWKFLLSLLPLHIYLKKIIVIILCLFFLIFSWTSISFLRAFYIFLLYEIGKIFNQQTTFLHLLSIVCLTILLLNPIQIFFLDFQLSFVLTFCLGWLAQISNSK
ncbi:ComEC/Rec2 family competence protein [Candidatus Babeliales bacterium]|nr:ComEC/Rec2 family competence protein [Candidatus Babeliales bacterium]